MGKGTVSNPADQVGMEYIKKVRRCDPSYFFLCERAGSFLGDAGRVYEGIDVISEWNIKSAEVNIPQNELNMTLYITTK